MKLVEGLDHYPIDARSCTVAIGRFDGVHRGHQKLISAAVLDARLHSRPSVVLTFDRHPAELLAPDRVPPYLTTSTERARLISSLGVDILLVAEFEEQFREVSPEAFMHFVLNGMLSADSVFVGPQFRFGRDQAGDAETLQVGSHRYGFEFTVVDSEDHDGVRISSTAIREWLSVGDLDRVNVCLGRNYVIEGRVVGGQQLGRTIGFPTANIETPIPLSLPQDGIYATWFSARGVRYRGACSIGFRPTVGGTTRTIEVYILDFDGDLYDMDVKVEFVKRLRGELKFDSLSTMVEQIERDVLEVRQLLR